MSNASERIRTLQSALAASRADALWIAPGDDLRWVLGTTTDSRERLCGVYITTSRAGLIVPALEEMLLAPAADKAGLEVTTWADGTNPLRILAQSLAECARVALSDDVRAPTFVGLAELQQDVTFTTATDVLGKQRMTKDDAELQALKAVGAAIDGVHKRVPDCLRIGRTEKQVAEAITELIAETHDTVEFVIVASGPNAASPHHHPGDRQLAPGDVVIVDIGGRLNGYCSDCTRTYVLGDPPQDFAVHYAALQDAQARGVAAATVGTRAADVDAVCRDRLAAADLAAYFVHRTGHGIGVSVHEAPYIAQDSDTTLAAGMAFSIEPGFYIPGRYGARIEDIVIATPDGPVRCNMTSTDLVRVDAS